MDGITFLLFVITVGVVLGLCWYFSARQRDARAMASVPIRSIAQLHADEKVRIVGKVELLTSARSPLSDRKCVYWHVIVEQRVNKHWQCIFDHHNGVDFLIREGEDAIRVKASRIKPVLDEDRHFSSGPFDADSPRLKAFLRKHGIESKGLIFEKSLRYREGVIEPGETVAAVGITSWERGSKGRKGKRRRMVLDVPKNERLLVSDTYALT